LNSDYDIGLTIWYFTVELDLGSGDKEDLFTKLTKQIETHV